VGWNLSGLAGSVGNLTGIVNPLLSTYVNFSRVFGFDDFTDLGAPGGTTTPGTGTGGGGATIQPAPNQPPPDYTPWLIGGAVVAVAAVVLIARKRK
jgi:hypothetical protein